jgi:hypothetical protein
MSPAVTVTDLVAGWTARSHSRGGEIAFVGIARGDGPAAQVTAAC